MPTIQTPNLKTPWNKSENVLTVILLVLGMLGEFVSGFATDIGVQTYFFAFPLSLGMTVFIQGSIIFSTVALKAAVSRQAFSEAWRLPFLGLLLLSFGVSVCLSSVGAYKEFGFKVAQTSDLLTQEKNDFSANQSQLDKVRQDDISVVNQKIGELNRQKAAQDSVVRGKRVGDKTRNMAAQKSAQLATQIKPLEELNGEFGAVVAAAFDDSANRTATDPIADARTQRQKLEAVRQTLVNLHNRMPEELRRDRNFPTWQSSSAPPTNEQSAFVADLRDRKTPALTALGFGLFLDLMCVLCAFAGVSFPTAAERIRRGRTWLRNVRQAFGRGTSTVNFVSREQGGTPVAANFKCTAEELIGADLEQARGGLEDIFSDRLRRAVTIRAFLNAEGGHLFADRVLIPQLGATPVVHVVFNDDEDDDFPDFEEETVV